MSCPKCNEKALKPITYEPNTEFAINGVSEVKCENCGYRECHWCHKELHGDERAKFACKGYGHPRVMYL